MSIFLIGGFVFVGLLTLATVVKWLEVRRATTWKTAPGRITRSHSVTRKVRTAEGHSRATPGQDLETRNFADIAYEYRAGGKRLRAKRISIGEDLGDFRVAETLARYPVDARVTVYYNPAKPSEAVLERDAPDGVFRTLAIFIVVLLAGLVATAIGTRELYNALLANMARPDLAFPVTVLAVTAVLVGLITRAGENRAEIARGWPWTDGEIVASGPEAVELWRDVDSFTRRRTFFKPTILYRYRIGETDLHGTRRDYGPRRYWASVARAREAGDGYRKGDQVAVFYNPENSSESVLEPQAAGLWIGWTLAAALAAMAVLLAF